MFKDRLRLFSEIDAIVCYFSARIIGQTILKELGYELSLCTYEINNDAYLNKNLQMKNSDKVLIGILSHD